MDNTIEIAKVKAGSFQGWFDKVNDSYEIQYYDNHSPRACSFKTKAEAQKFWHELIESRNFKHCYCC